MQIGWVTRFVRHRWWVTVGVPTALRCRSILGAAASLVPYTLMHPLGLLWRHEDTSAARIRCRPACVCLFWPHDGTSALGIRCRHACVFFLTARWHISTWKSLQASVCDCTMAHQHWVHIHGSGSVIPITAWLHSVGIVSEGSWNVHVKCWQEKTLYRWVEARWQIARKLDS